MTVKSLLMAYGHTLVTTLIPAADGSIITDALSTWGNSANAFDGITVQAEASCAAANAHGSAPAGTNYIGKDWGATQAHRVTKLVLTGPSNNSLLYGGGSTGTITLAGSNDNSAWTTLDSFSNSGGNGETITRTSTITATTAYRYHRVSITATGSVVEGHAIYRGILDTAEAINADLIVMGSHGRRGLEKLVLGSVTAQVLSHAHLPVLVVRD